MILAENFPYSHILLQFYQIVAHGHPKASENQAQLLNILNDNQLLIKQQNQKQIAKKISRATDYSFASHSDTISPQDQHNWTQDSLQFTFCPPHTPNQNHSQQTIHFKYKNQSIFKVVLYSLCFTYLHLQTSLQSGRKEVKHLISLNNTIFESLLSVIGGVKRQDDRQGNGQSCSLQLLAHFMLSVQARVETLVNHLKQLIDGLDYEAVRQACIATAHRISNPIAQQKPSKAAAQGERCEDESQNQQDDSDVLDLMATQMKLRVKLQSGKNGVRWGRKDSPMCIVIAQSPISFQFSLQEIICFEERQANVRNLKQSMEKPYQWSQLLQI